MKSKPALDLRKTGISVVGDVPWGTHFCYFYETKQDLLDILVPYFKAGLESKEFCLWIISNSELITTEEAKEAFRQAVSDLDRYLAQGSIEIVPHDEWFLYEGVFDFHRVANRFKTRLDKALASGFVGMRLNGSPLGYKTRTCFASSKKRPITYSPMNVSSLHAPILLSGVELISCWTSRGITSLR